MNRVHHLTFVVRDLEASLARFCRDFAVGAVHKEELSDRGVLTARFLSGELWFVLVQPVSDGIPMQHLREHGEGLLLVSFHTPDLDFALADFAARGVKSRGTRRTGVGNWQVVELESDAVPGSLAQLCLDAELSNVPG